MKTTAIMCAHAAILNYINGTNESDAFFKCSNRKLGIGDQNDTTILTREFVFISGSIFEDFPLFFVGYYCSHVP